MYMKLKNLPGNVLIFFVRVYQKSIRKIFPHKCAFYPCCSEYFILSVKRFGAFIGFFIGISRIIRCNPKNNGKIDLVSQNIKGEYKWYI